MSKPLPRHAVVTGANRGIGLAVARSLAERGVFVTVVARDAAAGERAVSSITQAGGRADLFVGDLGSRRGAKEAAAGLVKKLPELDLLVHNAGLWPNRREVDEDGLERAFVVNHLAPFLLSLALEPALATAKGRVVLVSAGLYIKGRPNLERTPRGEDFHAFRTYPTTKLMNLLTLQRFADRWRPLGVTIDALHPGVIRTGLGDRGGPLGLLLSVVKRFWKTPEQGAAPVVRLALDVPSPEQSGRWFIEHEQAELEPIAKDEALASRVWEQAASLAGA